MKDTFKVSQDIYIRNYNPDVFDTEVVFMRGHIINDPFPDSKDRLYDVLINKKVYKYISFVHFSHIEDGNHLTENQLRVVKSLLDDLARTEGVLDDILEGEGWEK